YNWSNGALTQDIVNLPAGTYSVTITDDNSCTLQISDRVISEPEFDLIASTSIVDEPSYNGDFDGRIRVDGAGGNDAPFTYQWNDPGSQTSQIADGLDAGFYTVTVTDFKGCAATDNVNLTEPDVLSVSAIVGDLNCFDNNSGTIALTVTGGTVPMSYLWSSSDGIGLVAVDKNQSGLSAGTYEVIVTDTYACEAVDSFLVSEPILLQIDTENKTDVTTCNGDNTGTITIAASGGTGVLTYTLNPGAVQTNTTGIFTGLIAGTYNVDVDDVNGCGPITSSTIVIGEPTVISIAETSVNDITCNGLADGSIDITASGGTVATVYTYSWITTEGSGLVASSEDQTGLGAGTYNLTVTDDNTCTGITSIVITEPTILNITETAVLDITCNGLTDGSIDITVSGGILSYTYSWTTTDGSGLVAASEDQTGLGAGTYDLTVTDGNLCTGTGTIVIIEPTAISIDSENFTDATTQTAADGSVTLTASGGTGTLEYTLSPGTIINTTGVFSNLIPDDYTVNVTDDNACGPVSSNTITVGYPDAIIDISKSDKIKMYPNPTSDKLFIEIDYEFDNLKIEVLSISGQIILNKEIKSHGITKEVLDLSAYPKGVYFIRIYNSTFIFKDKILLQ
nr:T9SS type A sorting domain-containing protein [Bacteroidales bacterium]